tara:strand:+ start:214 stop:555 length:342 start_codon:yes stop_codon:yes gene_type:complete
MEDNDNIDDNILASVSYTLYRGDDDVIIDASMGDYNLESNEAMAKIIKVLSSDYAIVHTINLVRDGLISNGHEELLVDLLTKLGSVIMDNATKVNEKEKTVDDKPCISPLDMM